MRLPGTILGGTVAVLTVLVNPIAAAQDPFAPRPPGPYVMDLRGAIVGVPSDPSFFPPVSDTVPVPARGFGLEIGAHILPFSLGPARLGIGAAFIKARGSITDPGAAANVTALVPQLSFNFGNRAGWSYLSAGYGAFRLKTELAAPAEDEADGSGTATAAGERTRDPGAVDSLNFGGGARWFVRDRLGIGFDVRFHRLAAKASTGTPVTTVVSTSVGFSIR